MPRLLPLVGLGLALALASYSCVDSRRTPTSPSPAAAVPAGGVNWHCLNPVPAGSTSIADWTFIPAQPLCPAPSSVAVAGSPVIGAPQNLRASVIDTTVRLDWGYPPGEFVNGFQLEAGSAPGLSNLAVFLLPSAPSFVVVNNVPPGVYYVRIRGTGGPLGPPSNEVEVRVGGCTGRPGPPSGMTAQVNNNVVHLAWNSPGGAVQSYIIEAGSARGLSNIVTFDTGNALTALTATAPNGVYYVRGRAQNACGVGAASGDLVVSVGGTTSSSSTTTSTTTTGPSTTISSSSSSTSTTTTSLTTTPSTSTIGSSSSSTSSSSTAPSTVSSSTTTTSSSSSTTSTTTTIPTYTVVVAEVFGWPFTSCNVEQATGCSPACRFQAVVTPSMPGAQYVWGLGNVGAVSTGSSDIINPDWRPGYCPLPSSTITTANVTVTAFNSMGAKATSPIHSVTIGTT